MIRNATFGRVLEHLKTGGAASRKNWRESTYRFITLGVNIKYHNLDAVEFAAENKDCGTQCIIMHTTDGSFVGWVPTQSDMLCEDRILL